MERRPLGEFELPERPGNRNFRSGQPSLSPSLSNSSSNLSSTAPSLPQTSTSSSSVNPPPLRDLAVLARPLRSQPLITSQPSFLTRVIHYLSAFVSRTGTYGRLFLQIAAVLALIYGFVHFRRFQERMVPHHSKGDNKPAPDPLKLLVKRRFERLSSNWFFQPMKTELQELLSAGIYSPEEAMVQLMCNELETATAELIILRGAAPSLSSSTSSTPSPMVPCLSSVTSLPLPSVPTPNDSTALVKEAEARVGSSYTKSQHVS